MKRSHRKRSVGRISASKQADADAVAESLAGVRNLAIKPLELKTFRQEPVSGVYFDSQQRIQMNIDAYSVVRTPVELPIPAS